MHRRTFLLSLLLTSCAPLDKIFTATPAPTQTPVPTPTGLPSPTLTPWPIATPTLRPTELVQPATPTPKAFMDYAFELRRLAVTSGDQNYGAIIVKQNLVVGLGPSRVVVNTDPSAHAEIEAIRDACHRLKTRDLTGCVMYSTSAPCRMCESAAYWANLSRLYYSAEILDAGAPRYGGR